MWWQTGTNVTRSGASITDTYAISSTTSINTDTIRSGTGTSSGDTYPYPITNTTSSNANTTSSRGHENW